MRERCASVAEIAPGIHRVATHHERWGSSTNQYVVTGGEPVLISTGLRERFAETWEGVARVLDPRRLRWIVVPHFEADECGALNEFLTRVPDAVAVASMRTVVTSLADFAARPPRGLGEGEVIAAGSGLRVVETPYVHAWDGIVLVAEAARVAFTSDLFAQPGRAEPISRDDRAALSAQLYTTLYGIPPEPYLGRALDRIETLAPAVLAPGHGSALTGNLTPYYRAYRQLSSPGTRPLRAPLEPAA